MNDLQSLASNWIASLAALLPVSYTFGAGMVAAVNPCGFAMLPAYLSLYLGVDDQSPVTTSSPGRRIVRALWVGTAVSLGFVLLFTTVGFVISAGGTFIFPWMPWVGAAIGTLLIILGVGNLVGKSFSTYQFQLLADRVMPTGSYTGWGFFLFGVAYGVASLSCTIPIFMVAVGSALTSGDLLAGLSRFVSYALGMSTVIVSLTLTIGLLKTGLVRSLRQTLPYIRIASAFLLILAGGWIVLYWFPYLNG